MPIVGSTIYLPTAYRHTVFRITDTLSTGSSIPASTNTPTVHLSLTTTFTVPSQCLLEPKVVTNIPTTFWLQGGYDTESCFPTGYPFSASRIVYSPGICPAGWYSACEKTDTAGSFTQSIVSCCPLYYECASSIPQEWESNFGCVSTYSPEVSGLLSSWNIGSSDVYVHSMYQAPVMIVSASTTPNLPIPTSQPTPTAAPPPSTSTAAPTPPSPSLSKGAIAGIAIGAILGMALVSLLAFIAWRLRKKRHTGVQNAPADKRDSNASDAPEVWHGEIPPPGAYHRQEPAELAAIERPVEMSVS